MQDPQQSSAEPATEKAPGERSRLGLWGGLQIGLGAALAAGAHLLAGLENLRPSQKEGLPTIFWIGVGLAVLGLLAVLSRRRLRELFDDAVLPSRTARSPYLTLFLASFAALFVEVMLIRYTGSQIRVFAFYKNVPLIAAFLGLGLGCCLQGARSRHALAFLLWLVPLTAFLSQGALLLDGYLSSWAALGSSEQILGDVVVRETGGELSSQLAMGLFCVLTLVVVALLFTLLGRLLGSAFEGLPRLPAYTVNILGSLAGILGFVAVSRLQAPPVIWYAVGLLPLFWWLRGRARLVAAVGLAVLSAGLVVPSVGTTVWSPYQKLVGHEIPPGPGGSGTSSPSYLVQISDVFYQIAIDLRPEVWAGLGGHPFPHYDAAYAGLPEGGRVLIVGAGTGNDVAAALRAGAGHVDAVDIDPAIVEMGRRHHPEAPYSDPRVRVVVDDARTAFRKLGPGTYDAVVFGLLDSHTQLGISSVRLDNYVFTRESFRSAARLLKSGGRLVVTAATFRPWFRDRLEALTDAACTKPARITAHGVWLTFSCAVEGGPPEEAPEATVTVPTDDWPFLYLPERGVPRAYLLVIGLLAVTSVVFLRRGGIRVGRWSAYHAHLFFLGAAFLLMEVYAINRLALLFGTTWLVSAVTIALVLTLIVAGNLTIAAWSRLPYGVAYGALVTSLLASYFASPELVLGRGLALSLLYGLAVLSPVYFAALIFARSFRAATVAGPAIGVNILGSVLGGWVEYATMATGIRAMVLLALVFYLFSLLAWLRTRDAAEPRPPSADGA